MNTKPTAEQIAALPELVNAIRAIVDEHGKPDYAPIEERRAQWDRLYAALAKMEEKP